MCCIGRKRGWISSGRAESEDQRDRRKLRTAGNSAVMNVNGASNPGCENEQLFVSC